MATKCGNIGSFSLFSLFPTELRDLVWFHAANYGPSIQFFYSREPHGELSVHSDMDLIPDREAAVLNLLNLSLACKAAHAVVLKKFKALDNPTILRNPHYRTCPSMSLRLDLRSDVVCSRGFGIPYEWAEYSHVIFTSTRRFGIRCTGKWTRQGLRVFLCDHRDHWVLEGRVRACPECINLGAILLRKFSRLQYFYLVLDTPLDWPPMKMSNGEKGSVLYTDNGFLGERESFHTYQDAYFEVTVAQQAWGDEQSIAPLPALKIEDELVLLFERFSVPAGVRSQQDLSVKLLGRRMSPSPDN